MKTSKRWNDIKSEMTTNKGFWSLKIPSKQIYKIQKFEDFYRRRFHLKSIKESEEKVYLSYEKYQNQLDIERKIRIKLSYAPDSPINSSTSLSIVKRRSCGKLNLIKTL